MLGVYSFSNVISSKTWSLIRLITKRKSVYPKKDKKERKGWFFFLFTLGFDKNFTGFGARDVKFFNGERFVWFPEHSCSHVRRQPNSNTITGWAAAAAPLLISQGRRRRWSSSRSGAPRIRTRARASLWEKSSGDGTADHHHVSNFQYRLRLWEWPREWVDRWRIYILGDVDFHKILL